MATAVKDAQSTLTVTSDTGLLDALLILTHAIAGERAARRDAHARGWAREATRHDEAARSYHVQRAQVRVEILRRMGGAQ